MQSIEVIAPRYDIAWYPWAVQYFFLVALSYTSLWLAFPGTVLGLERWKPVARLALVAAVTTAIVAPVSLLADLHQPLRFWHFYAYFTPWSWMSIGSVFLPLFVLLTVALAWLVWREPMKAWRGPGLVGGVARIVTLGDWTSPRWSVVLTGLGAFAASIVVAVYTGYEIAVIKGRPLWHTDFLPVMFVATGLIGSTGLLLVLDRFTGTRAAELRAMGRAASRSRATSRQLLMVLLIACVLAGITAALWFAVGLGNRDPSVAAALDSVQDNPDWRAMTFRAIATGGLLFLGVLVLLLRPQIRGLAWVFGLLALHTAWMFRWAVLMNVQTVQRQTAGFSEYHLAMGSGGLLGIVGSFGLWLAVLMLIDIFVPWRAALGGAGEPAVSPDPKGVPSHG
ncbi:tetrathionate reductase [Palleronia sediminis]|uniref:Tetrathionate reductase n=1 Tax=Palleronia sediminis TaxID=2547833 RepID=A0A4R6ADK3_9RHOB|nr:NrfD/PsrC family molybdoenzyme membrane anchor subunit [Palleronia sediminis]TDL81092.1 tetrathionate reductase [Palleronia sediminis]